MGPNPIGLASLFPKTTLGGRHTHREDAVGSPQTARGAGRGPDPPLEPPKGARPCPPGSQQPRPAWISDFWSPAPERMNLCDSSHPGWDHLLQPPQPANAGPKAKGDDTLGFRWQAWRAPRPLPHSVLARIVWTASFWGLEVSSATALSEGKPGGFVAV